MIYHLIISLLFLSTFFNNPALPPQASAAHVAGDSPAPTAYQILQSYDFPVGILPKGVTHYDFDPTTGKFHAYLNGTCSFSLEGSYQLSYKSVITGYIGKGKLSNLGGISVKVLFMWLNIAEVYRNSDILKFSVGISSANFPVDNFDVSPQCGCGLNCNSSKMESKTEPLISSI